MKEVGTLESYQKPDRISAGAELQRAPVGRPWKGLITRSAIRYRR